MNKTHKYTILTVLLTLVFSLGSMAGLNLILRIREHQLLSEHGETNTESVVREWQKPATVSTEQMEEVVRSGGENWQLTAHAPLIDQISMDEAVKAGKIWLTQMELDGYNWEEDTDSQIRSVYAVLGTLKEPSEAHAKPYCSFWKVSLSGHTMDAVLYVNAVTAGIWQAKLTIYENLPEEMPYWKLRDFLELSELAPDYKGAVRNEEETASFWKIADSPLCARMDFAHRDESGYRKGLSIPDDNVIEENRMKRENVKLTLTLDLTEDAEEIEDSKQ